MSTVVVALLGLTLFFLGYRFYSRFIGEQVYRINSKETQKTPAHEFRDGVDYVPTRKWILWGHHYSSIAGAAPIVGPAIAVIWGWVPAFIWVVLGAILAGAVQDFGALVISIRNKGESIGKVTEAIIGPRSRSLFLTVIFLLLLIVGAVFALIIAILFVEFPGSVLPINFQILAALWIGMTIHRRGKNIFWPSIAALIALYLMIGLGWKFPIHAADIAGPIVAWMSDPSAWTAFQNSLMLGSPDYTLIREGEILFWIHFLMIYGYVSSILPVWTLLQPRDYINSHQLLVGISLIYLGLFVAARPIVAPAFNFHPEGAPPIIPFLFVTIACGAISGFHSLVSSGTTAKQIDTFQDSRPIGYGGMLGEGILALAAILAATAGFESLSAWTDHFQSWGHAGSLAAKISAFVNGAALFIDALGIPRELAVIFVSVMIISFANTSLDTAFRIQRYVVGEFGKFTRIRPLAENRYIQAGVAVFTAYLLAVFKSGGKGGMVLWPLFGSTNQLIGSLSLLVISVWVYRQGRPVWYTLAPMIFLTVVTGIALGVEIHDHALSGDWLLLTLSVVILFCEFWIIYEAFSTFRYLKIKTSSMVGHEKIIEPI